MIYLSLDKAIKYGKEKRKPYSGAKAVSCSCRNHGSCSWCRNNRLYQQLKCAEATKLDQFVMSATERGQNAQEVQR